MKKISLAFLLIAALTGYSQNDPEYKRSFDSLQHFIKNNYAGFEDKVNPESRDAYIEHTDRHKQMLSRVDSDAQYFAVISSWLRFFKDKHLSMSAVADTANGRLAAAIAAREKYPLEKISMTDLEKSDATSIEGIYYSPDTSYKIAVIKSDNGFRKYAGVILSSKVPEWKPGFIKFELIPSVNQEVYDFISYNRYHRPQYGQFDFQSGNVFHTEGWYKNNFNKHVVLSKGKTILFPEEKTNNAFFRKLDEQTSYLRVRSFGDLHIKTIDSVINTNRALIETLPYLIIDIRGNGGGADISYRSLKKIVYTDPVKLIGVDLLATAENIDNTISLIMSIDGIPPAEKKEYIDIYEAARKSGSRMFNVSNDTIEIAEAVPFPKRVALVIDRFCASTAEQFILEARQSKKVTLFGTSTRGVLDYANVRDKLFSAGFYLHYPTTRSRRIDVGQGIDNTGIRPDVEVDLKEDGWLQIVRDLIRK